MTDMDTLDGWRKSSFCDNSSGNCVEVKCVGGAFALRDTKDPDGPVLVFAGPEWTAFTTGVCNGEFDK
jgi:hypothetical protein